MHSRLAIEVRKMQECYSLLHGPVSRTVLEASQSQKLCIYRYVLASRFIQKDSTVRSGAVCHIFCCEWIKSPHVSGLY